MREWRFLLDENVDPKTGTYLEKEGVDAEHVREAVGLGATDDKIRSYAEEDDRIIVTSDVTDFTTGTDSTVVLLYDDTTPAYRVAAALLEMIDAYRSPAEFPDREELDPWR